MSNSPPLWFTNLSHELKWKDYYVQFSSFGSLRKLYIDPTGTYGYVQFECIKKAQTAVQKLNEQPLLNLSVSLNPPDCVPAKTITNALKLSAAINMTNKSHHRGYDGSNVDVYKSPVQYVDVNGRLLDTLQADDGQVYISVKELKQSGFEVYTAGALPKHGQQHKLDEQQLYHLEIFLKCQATNFILSKGLTNLKGKEDNLTNKIMKEYSSLDSPQPTSSGLNASKNFSITIENGRHNSRRCYPAPGNSLMLREDRYRSRSQSRNVLSKDHSNPQQKSDARFNDGFKEDGHSNRQSRPNSRTDYGLKEQKFNARSDAEFDLGDRQRNADGRLNFGGHNSSIRGQGFNGPNRFSPNLKSSGYNASLSMNTPQQEENGTYYEKLESVANNTPLRRPHNMDTNLHLGVMEIPATTASNNAPHASRPRKLVIENVSSSGVFMCSEVLTKNTFVGCAIPLEFAEDMALLELITVDCEPDPEFKPNIGDLVAVAHENGYVRGLVINNVDGQYSCALIDFGVVVTNEEVRPLKDKYKEVPEFACFCTVDPSFIQEMAKISEGNDMKIEKPTVITVTLSELKEDVVVEGSRWDPFTTSSVAGKLPVQPTQAIFKMLPKVHELKPDEAVLIFAENNGSLLLRTQECVSCLKAIKQDLSTFQAEPFLKPPEVNQLAVCKYLDDELHRVIVVKLNGANAIVNYFDYGDTETVPVKDMKAINAKLANMECTLIKITMKGFVNGKFSPAVIKYLAEVKEKKIKFSVTREIDNIYDLKLRDGSFLSEKLAALDAPVAVKKPKSPVPLNSNPTYTVVDMSETPTCKVNMGINRAICVDTSTIAEGTVTFWLLTKDCQIETVEKMVNNQIAIDSTPYSPTKVNEACLAKFEDEWFRAAVVGIEDNTYGLFFLDYGNLLYATAKDIRKTTREIAQIKCCGMWCVLDGMKKEDEAIEESLLSRIKQDLIGQEEYDIDVLSVDDAGWYDITIPSLYKAWKTDGLL